MNSACELLRGVPSTRRETLTLLVHFRVNAENTSSADPVHNCLEALARDVGPDLVPAALAATALEAKRWWKEFGGDVPSMFDSMALARTSLLRPFEALGARALPGLKLGVVDRDPFVRAEAAAFLDWLGPVAKPMLPTLKKALARERSRWARREMQLALEAIAR